MSTLPSEVLNNIKTPRQVYEEEKAVGIRKPNGARKMSQLKPRHYQIIKLHLEGKSNNEICKMAAKEGGKPLRPATVSIVLNDPLSQEIIQALLKDKRSELEALQSPAIEAVRDSLQTTQSLSNRLKGVDRFIKLKEALVTDTDSEKGAEAIIADILGSVADIVRSATGNNNSPQPDPRVINPEGSEDIGVTENAAD